VKLTVQVDPVARLCGAVHPSYNIVDENGQAVAVLTTTGQERELARLFAAAPDLLTALEAMIEAADGDSDDQDGFFNLLGAAMVQARAVIARCKGGAS